MRYNNRIDEARAIIENIVNRLRRDYEPEQIILFGSYAYGNPTDESDLDFLIVKETTEPILARWLKVRKLVSDLRTGFGFSPIVITPSELEKRLGKGDQFFEEIMSRGKKLYAR
ncbi:MAG: nucleotidyltransferase domain-containing protein [Candidatus Methanoperedens sp.]|jgi:predicted nucleotidyltransferase|nr:nucleotidyltransferase domain-containing protein [Candidatus Methanoperedens sp.]PKL53483.1 MAG: nucleotidyltransferase domain-containing protein [Candidatus Methanoperedenaceae archaeon HGW-Methanoperedenaceae-1]